MIIARQVNAAVMNSPEFLSNDEDEFMAELTEMPVEFAPRRFALCGVWPNREDAQVIGWE